jgi:hypothetical protein
MPAPAHRPLQFAVVARVVLLGVVLLGVVVVGSVGCGDLSQEDLLFRAAIPSKDAVAVVPPGSGDDVDDVDDGAAGTGQALTADCPDGDLRCEAAAIARNFNGLTFGLLDIVDRIASFPPTRRAAGRRVWGPVFDADKDRTFRFEMVRDDDVTFGFCLHAAAGRHDGNDGDDDDDSAAELGCDVDESGPFLRVLDGAFSPDSLADASARNGAGTMHLDVDALATLGGGDRFARDLIFAFDNRDDATSIHVDLQGARVNDVDRDAGYDFDRDATGAGSFALVIFKDVVDGALARSRAERVRLLARWQPDGSGRAAGIVDEGNTQTPITVAHCWDAGLSTTYTQAVDGTTSGDEATCALSNDDVVPPT